MNILYRDQWMIAIDKPIGVLVHPGDDPNTVAPVAMKVLRDQIGAKLWSVHRLDCPTSGVLLYLLSQDLLPHIRKLFAWGGVEKAYTAIVVGETSDSWIADQPLQKNESEPEREAETLFERKAVVQLSGQTISVLSVKPITGRYHQIRKHLAMSGFPILGDYRYGEEEVNNRLLNLLGESRLMLHARQLAFTHPVTSEDLVINAPMPTVFEEVKFNEFGWF